MKSIFLIFCAAFAIACAEVPEPVWCTGDGTAALIRDRSEYNTGAWTRTYHPSCRGKPLGHLVFLEDLPERPDLMLQEIGEDWTIYYRLEDDGQRFYYRLVGGGWERLCPCPKEP